MITDETLLNRLTKLAETGTGRFRMAAAVLDKSGNVLSVAANSYCKTHPRQAFYANKYGDRTKQFLHAEMSALIKAKEGVPYKMVVVRVGKGGSLRNAAPCPICSMAIKDAGIKFIEYTT
jgi:tRNA(Arg) A34 adenosine deaminase TadA